jgi:CBS domain containing-hemolysin-like protein
MGILSSAMAPCWCLVLFRRPKNPVRAPGMLPPATEWLGVLALLGPSVSLATSLVVFLMEACPGSCARAPSQPVAAWVGQSVAVGQLV